MPLDIGIDLGTATVQVYAGGEILLSEPSVIAFNKNTGNFDLSKLDKSLKQSQTNVTQLSS